MVSLIRVLLAFGQGQLFFVLDSPMHCSMCSIPGPLSLNYSSNSQSFWLQIILSPNYNCTWLVSLLVNIVCLNFYMIYSVPQHLAEFFLILLSVQTISIFFLQSHQKVMILFKRLEFLSSPATPLLLFLSSENNIQQGATFHGLQETSQLLVFQFNTLPQYTDNTLTLFPSSQASPPPPLFLGRETETTFIILTKFK